MVTKGPTGLSLYEPTDEAIGFITVVAHIQWKHLVSELKKQMLAHTKEPSCLSALPSLPREGKWRGRRRTCVLVTAVTCHHRIYMFLEERNQLVSYTTEPSGFLTKETYGSHVTAYYKDYDFGYLSLYSETTTNSTLG